MSGHSVPHPERPDRPIDTVLRPIQRFMRVEASGGVLLLVCTVAALVWANIHPASYDSFWHTHVTVGFGAAVLDLSLAHFVNDGLMAIFFFVVGLEIKREIMVGELSSFQQAAIPIAAAIGGMIVPALIYVVLNLGGEGSRGWAIPMATDIAFAIGVLALLGRRVPLSLKVFLTALAIADDIGAVMVIAAFYTSHIAVFALVAALVLIALSMLCNLLGVRTPLVYALIGIAMWLMLLKSGVHATIGGVLLALTIPAKMRIDGGAFLRFGRAMLDKFEQAGSEKDEILNLPNRQAYVVGLERACEHAQAPLGRMEGGLHPWVAFVIMPIFALANAGVVIFGSAAGEVGLGEAMGSRIGLGVILGLLVGKPVGIVLATWLAVRIGLGPLPHGATWRQVVGTGLLAGIGFTMSLFIANLGFGDDAAALFAAKIGILGGSLVAGVAGFLLLRTAPSAAPPEE